MATTVENRITKLILIIGYNGTGKTTVAKKLILAQLKAGARVLVVTPDDIELNQIPLVHQKHKHHIKTYVGARRLIWENEETLEVITQHFDNGLLLFDDCRAYLGAATDQNLHKLLIRRRQKMLDIIAVAHHFNDIPPKMYIYASEIILFRTNGEISRDRLEKLNEPDKILQAKARIDEAAKTNPHAKEIIKLI